MAELGVVEDTLFVPMVGRIYASEHFPELLYDEKALALKGRLPAEIVEQDRQGQYTLIASASRSANMDRYIRDFLSRNPDGAVVQLGCGLETTFFRGDNGTSRWFSVDLPNVIAYRRALLPESDRETYIAGSAFEDGWLSQVRAELPDAPLLLIASGLFYYFTEEDVLGLVRMLQGNGKIEMVFDTVNKQGMAMMHKKHMKDVGHADANMYFYVERAGDLVKKSGGAVEVLAEEPFYRFIPRKGLQMSTRISMNISDRLGMVKMVHLRIGEKIRQA